jgi:phage tail-like protein
MTIVQQGKSLSTIATDPLRNFKFSVTIQPTSSNAMGAGAVHLGFMTVSGLGMNLDVIPYRTGEMNTTTQKMVGQADFNPITLTRGVTVNSSQPQIEWLQQLFTVNQGEGTAAAGADYRCQVYVYVLDHPYAGVSIPSKAGFHIYNAWPSSVAYSDLDAGANQLFITQLSLAHEGFVAVIAADSGPNDIPSLA